MLLSDASVSIRSHKWKSTEDIIVQWSREESEPFRPSLCGLIRAVMDSCCLVEAQMMHAVGGTAVGGIASVIARTYHAHVAYTHKYGVKGSS